jgi:hypothetical protein
MPHGCRFSFSRTTVAAVAVLLALALAFALTACAARPTAPPSGDPSGSPTLTSTPLPTQKPTATPIPTGTPGPVSSPTPTPVPVPTLTRAQVDVIGVGFEAWSAYQLTGFRFIEGVDFPTTFAIREGGTVTFTYSEILPDNTLRYILSKTVTDASGTVTTTAVPDPSPVADWTIRKGDIVIDVATLNTEGGSISDLLALLGTPLSDRTQNMDSPYFGKIRYRTLDYEGLAMLFSQPQDTTTPDHWSMESAYVSKAGYATPRGVAIGAVDVDLVRAFGTGAYDLYPEFDNGVLSSFMVLPLDVMSGESYPLQFVIHFEAGKVNGFGFERGGDL